MNIVQTNTNEQSARNLQVTLTSWSSYMDNMQQLKQDKASHVYSTPTCLLRSLARQWIISYHCLARPCD